VVVEVVFVVVDADIELVCTSADGLSVGVGTTDITGCHYRLTPVLNTQNAKGKRGAPRRNKTAGGPVPHAEEQQQARQYRPENSRAERYVPTPNRTARIATTASRTLNDVDAPAPPTQS
jgi:hypothetical protein